MPVPFVNPDVAALYDVLCGIRGALERIATMLEATAAADGMPVAAAASDTPPVCDHPLDQRIDFGTTDGRPDWQCGVKTCGFRSLSDAADAAGVI